MFPVIRKTRVVICTEDRDPLQSSRIMDSKAYLVRAQLEQAFGSIGRIIDEYVIVNTAQQIPLLFVGTADDHGGQRISYDGYVIFLSGSMVDVARRVIDILASHGKLIECMVISSSHRPTMEIKTCFRGETVAFRRRKGEGALVVLNHFCKADILIVGEDAETKEG